VWGANDKIVVGHIGVNNRGKDHVKRLADCTAALCDVDQQVLEREQRNVAAGGGKCDVYGDYRRLLDRKDIDAVVIASPDHWHALMAVAACEAGKDVYCEKPLSLTITEGRAMVAAARKYGRVFQTGSQQRSDARFRLACELVRASRLGKLERIEAGIPKAGQSQAPVPDCDPPAWLDYQLWLGPAPQRRYNPMRVHVPHRAWRWWWDYSGGMVTNWGAHQLDIAQWALDADQSGPIEVSGSGQYHPEGWFPVPFAVNLQYRYANGVTVEVASQFKLGVTFVGSEGRLFVSRGKIESDPPEIVKRPLGAGGVHPNQSTDHVGNWLDCIRSRKSPICDVEIGHRSATACHLGNIALRTGRTIHWDPVAERIVGDEEAAGMLRRPYREPWRQPG
jgi:predicted dehydrogenase